MATLDNYLTFWVTRPLLYELMQDSFAWWKGSEYSNYFLPHFRFIGSYHFLYSNERQKIVVICFLWWWVPMKLVPFLCCILSVRAVCCRSSQYSLLKLNGTISGFIGSPESWIEDVLYFLLSKFVCSFLWGTMSAGIKVRLRISNYVDIFV